MDWKKATRERFSAGNSAGKWDAMYNEETERLDEANFRRRRDFTIRTVDASCRPGDHILDAGCGTGPVVAELIERGYRCIGTDCAPDMLAFARHRLAARGLPADVLMEADVARLPFATGTFSCVVCLGVISYIPDYTTAFKELFRVLKPGGLAIVSFRNRYNRILSDPVALLRHLLGRKRSTPEVAPSTIGDFLDPEAVRRAAAACGFELTEFKGIGFGPFRVRRRKLLSERASIRVSDGLTRTFTALRLQAPFRWLTDVNILLVRKPTALERDEIYRHEPSVSART